MTILGDGGCEAVVEREDVEETNQGGSLVFM